MDTKRVSEIFCIPRGFIKQFSKSRAVALVTEEWMEHCLQNKGSNSSTSWTKIFQQPQVDELLAPSNTKLPKPWIRICIKEVKKSGSVIPCLPEGYLLTSDGSSLHGYLADICMKNYNNMWKTSYQKHGKQWRNPHQNNRTQQNPTEALSDQKQPSKDKILRHLQRIHPKATVIDKMAQSQESVTSKNCKYLSNIIPVLAVVNTEQRLYVLEPYFQHTVHSALSYSPAIATQSFAKPLFILYQILNAMMAFHEEGIRVGDLSLHNILIDDKLWVSISSLNFMEAESLSDNTHLSLDASHSTGSDVSDDSSSRYGMGDLPSCQIGFQPGVNVESDANFMMKDAVDFLSSFHLSKYCIKDLPTLVQSWVNQELSNFKYLMILNYLAGRRLGDPNQHPVLPWVMDFTGPDTGFRDLTMSKFRLNKGDSQLDLTYNTFSGANMESTIPHHVPDVLSDITYYVYKARRTPKSILCTHVRSKWVPNEYPSSMQRMQEWTPDECIPEFFTDCNIFTSIHEDLPDIELPPWSNNSMDFINKHLAVLESEAISENLHHWIDLTFGYKLTGSPAVKAKNVNLKLVDKHTSVSNHGVIQLFTEPHPHRMSTLQKAKDAPPRVPKNMLFPQISSDGTEESTAINDRRSAPENATVKLPKLYDPLADLNHLEALYSFSSQAMKCLPESGRVQSRTDNCDVARDMVSRDMQAFGCVACEIFMTSEIQMQERCATLDRRYQMIYQHYQANRTCLPRLLQFAASILLQLDKSETSNDKPSVDCKHQKSLFRYPIINSSGLPPPTPQQLLHPMIKIIQFPSYFPKLYECLASLLQKDNEIQNVHWKSQRPLGEKEKIIKVIARQKVTIVQKFLERFQGKMSAEGIEILLPYCVELFSNEDTNVQAAWSLFNMIGQEIGQSETVKHFLQHLTKMFNGENSTPKHMKIYHRSFLIQLLMRLGLRVFLSNFSTLLVEAVAGYKDYIFEDLYNESQEEEVSKISQDKGLPPLSEENFSEDESCSNDLQIYGSEDGCDSEVTKEMTDPTESTLDEAEDIDDEVADDMPSNEECIYDTEADTQSIGSFNPNEVETSSSSDRSELMGSTQGTYDNRSVDSASIHSIPRTMEENSVSVSDLEDNAWTGGDEDASSECLQFQGDEEVEETRRPVKPDFSQSEPFKLASPTATKGMVRSETDEFATTMSDRTAEEVINICDVTAESIKWLSRRLGPLLTAKFLSRNLIRMLALCYLGDEQLISIGDTNKKLLKTSRLVCGDRNCQKVLECLSHIAQLYGQQVVLLQYIPCALDMVNMAKKRMTQKSEAGVISALILLRHILPLLSDSTLMDILQETLIAETIIPVIKLVSSVVHNFPGGSTVRTVICHKLIDLIYVIGLRIGFEMTRNNMTNVLNEFFICFNQIHGNQLIHKSDSSQRLQESEKSLKSQGSSDDQYCNIKIDSRTQEYTIGTPISLGSFQSTSSQSPSQWNPRKSYSLTSMSTTEEREESSQEVSNNDQDKILQELSQVFTPELAMASYIPFCRIFGSIHIEQCLPNETLIRSLCSKYDVNMDRNSSDSGSEPQSPCQDVSNASESLGSNIELSGNKIHLNQDIDSGLDIIRFGPIHRSSRILKLDPDEIKCEMKDKYKPRHLKGNWLAYWEHELGLSERDILFNFKQIKLQTFEGHTSSIRSITVLDNENSFISASKDKTVKLWSIDSFGDGSGRSRCLYSYNQHKKSVFSAVYLESVRLVASCDSSVHVWDPFTCEVLRQLESQKYSPVTALTCLPAPSPMVITATNEATLRYLDLRVAGYAHEFKTAAVSTGLIRSVTVSPDGQWIAIGFSTGYMSLLDQRTGSLIATWKGHDGEILQLKAYNQKTFISTSFDSTMRVWNIDDLKESCLLKGHTEPAHCFVYYKGQIISATTNNKITVHSSADTQANFTATKLRSDTFKGVLTSLAVLPMNKTLLLGADNGNIRLLC